MKTFYCCQREIEDQSPCIDQCDHCRDYYRPLEEERRMEDLKEWREKSITAEGIKPNLFGTIDTELSPEEESERIEYRDSKQLDDDYPEYREP